MSGLELVPYRIAPSQAIEPIDPSIVPDCGRAETRSLVQWVKDADSEIEKSRERFIIRAVIAPTFTVLLAIVITAALVVGAGPAFGALLMTAMIGAPGLYYFDQACGDKIWSRRPEAQRLREFHARVTARLRQRESLERLTGTARQADDLEAEIRSFNSDIGNLPVDALNAHDHDRIEERRRAILQRVNAFHCDILSASDAEEPKLLTAPDAA